MQDDDNSGTWERQLLSKIAQAAVTEQRRSRRWGIFFKLAFLTYIVVATALFYTSLTGVGGDGDAAEKHTALVRVDGVIAADQAANAGAVVGGLRAAFEDDKTAGVVLSVNSPGGSPVQAGLIYDWMLKLREQYPDTPLYAVLGDVAASGGYYVAAAAQDIYANRASIVGSIGVRADSFGVVELMDKLGVERRLYTAGENKALLDPFLPEDRLSVAHFESLLTDVHQQFIDAVKTGRGDRLRADAPGIFSGLVWTGDQSVELGLVDGLGSVRYVAEEIIDAKEIKDFTASGNLLDRVIDKLGFGIVSRLGLTPGAAVDLRLY